MSGNIEAQYQAVEQMTAAKTYVYRVAKEIFQAGSLTTDLLSELGIALKSVELANENVRRVLSDTERTVVPRPDQKDAVGDGVPRERRRNSTGNTPERRKRLVNLRSVEMRDADEERRKF